MAERAPINEQPPSLPPHNDKLSSQHVTFEAVSSDYWRTLNIPQEDQGPVNGSATLKNSAPSAPGDFVPFIDAFKDSLTAYVGETVASTLANAFGALLGAALEVPESIGWIIGLLENARTRGSQFANRDTPSTLLDLQVLAALANSERVVPGDAAREALSHGLDPARFTEYRRAFENVPSIAEGLRLWVRDLIGEQTLDTILRFNGQPRSWWEDTKKLVVEVLGVTESISLWLREEISESDLDARLGKLGYIDADKKHIKSLALFIPPVADLVRMAVREAFDEGQSSILNLDAEFPAPFAKFARQQGVSEDWAKKYWRAHWELPSPTQAFEMQHRDVITTQELQALLKAQDYAPTWRDKLLAISYNTITRVDVRRMYEMGIIDANEVEKQYRHGGYSPENAKRLRDFVVADVFESTVSPIRARLLTLFRKGIVDENELRAFLKDLQMPADRMERFIAAEKMLAEEERAERIMNAVKAQYMASRIDEVTASARLVGLGISVIASAKILQEWIELKRSRITRLSARDIHQALGRGLIDEKRAKKWLKERGMSDEEIEIFIKLDIVSPEEEIPPPVGSVPSFTATDRAIARAIANEQI